MGRSAPRIFIASSSEGIATAEAMKARLEPTISCTIWQEGVFRLSSYTLIDLEIQLSKTDYAIFIFTRDDISFIRGKEVSVVRDNVIYELGLFTGKLGREHCYIVMPSGTDKSHIPTDLSGIYIGYYDPEGHEGNLEAELGTIAYKIKTAIAGLDASSAIAFQNEIYKLAAQVVSKDIEEKFGASELENTLFSKLSAILKIVAKQTFYEEYTQRTTITPNVDGTIFEFKTYTECILHTPEKEYSSLETVSWFESRENRDSLWCSKLMLDGIEITTQYNEAREYVERSSERHFNSWGTRYKSIQYPSDGTRHEVVKEITSKKYVQSAYVGTMRQRIPIKKYELSILISGPYAANWAIEYNNFTAFNYRTSPDKNKYRAKYHTLQNVQINYDDWVFPGAGYMYIVRPKLASEILKISSDEM